PAWPSVVRRRPHRPQRSGDRRVADRQGRVDHPDVLAERIQPGPGAVPPYRLRGRSVGERISVPAAVCHRSARGASVLRTIMTAQGSRLTAVVIAACAAGLVGAPRLGAQGKLNVVAATEDLAAIAREVGGDKISVDSIAKGYQDPHFVEAKP